MRTSSVCGVRREPVRIAMIGQKGVPASYGGIEHHVEELGSRLARRGHEVTVYCRRGYCAATAATHRGMALAHVPTIGTKHLDAIVHSALSTVHAMRREPDVIHFHALGPGLLAPLPRITGRAKVVLTVHGRDDQRAKWSPGARAVLGVAGWMSATVPDATIAVSQALADSYASHARHRVVYIPNGAPEDAVPVTDVPGGRAAPGGALDRLGLDPGRYLLWVGRVVPEKAPDVLLRAYRRVEGDTRLVVVGGSSFTDAFTARVRELAAHDRRVCMADYQFGADLDELYRNALGFVLPSDLEGLPLTLLEAVAHGLPIVASAIAPHVEVLGATSAPGRRLFPRGDERALAAALRQLVGDPHGERRGANAARPEVMARYSWDRAADATERLYEELLGVHQPSIPSRAA